MRINLCSFNRHSHRSSRFHQTKSIPAKPAKSLQKRGIICYHLGSLTKLAADMTNTTNAAGNRTSNPATLRADKWLWAARFFKTRALAKDAIESGKVQLAGQKIKASRALQQGDILTIRQGSATKLDEKQVCVLALSDKRGNAATAALLYKETAASCARRAFMDEQRQLQLLAHPDSKPDKKARRQLAAWRELMQQ